MLDMTLESYICCPTTLGTSWRGPCPQGGMGQVLLVVCMVTGQLVACTGTSQSCRRLVSIIKKMVLVLV